MPPTSPKNSRRIRSPKALIIPNNGPPGNLKKPIISRGISRSFPISNKKRSPKRNNIEFKQRSRRKRSVKNIKSIHKKSHKLKHSRKKIIAIYTAGLNKQRNISYISR